MSSEADKVEKAVENQIEKEIVEDITFEDKDDVIERFEKAIQPIVAVAKAAEDMPEGARDTFLQGFGKITPFLYGKLAADILGSGKPDFLDKILAYRMLLKKEEGDGRDKAWDILEKFLLETKSKLDELEKEKFFGELSEYINKSLENITKRFEEIEKELVAVKSRVESPGTASTAKAESVFKQLKSQVNDLNEFISALEELGLVKKEKGIGEVDETLIQELEKKGYVVKKQPSLEDMKKIVKKIVDKKVKRIERDLKEKYENEDKKLLLGFTFMENVLAPLVDLAKEKWSSSGEGKKSEEEEGKKVSLAELVRKERMKRMKEGEKNAIKEA